MAFKKFKTLGDTQLEHNLGSCTLCSYEVSVHRFKGNKSKKSIGYVIETQRDIISDISHCSFFRGNGEQKNDIHLFIKSTK